MKKPKAMPGGSLEPVGSVLKCGNCGAPAYAHAVVSAGNERMPGPLCVDCIRVHKAEIMFRIPNAAGERLVGLRPVYSEKLEVAAIELIDGAYDIIELWRADSPAQKAWQEAWLKKAKELGANPSW